MTNSMDIYRDRLWLAFMPNVLPREARKRFLERFGYSPDMVRDGTGLILAGPVIENAEKEEEDA